jgi:hypothetical protein
VRCWLSYVRISCIAIAFRRCILSRISRQCTKLQLRLSLLEVVEDDGEGLRFLAKVLCETTLTQPVGEAKGRAP